MNRHKFTVHLALAAALVLLAAIVGQVRRWDWRSEFTPQPSPQQVAPAAQDEAEAADSEEESGTEDEDGPARAEVLVRFKAGTTEVRPERPSARRAEGPHQHWAARRQVAGRHQRPRRVVEDARQR